MKALPGLTGSALDRLALCTRLWCPPQPSHTVAAPGRRWSWRSLLADDSGQMLGGTPSDFGKFPHPSPEGSQSSGPPDNPKALGIVRVLDPMAGTGLHARFFQAAGFKVTAEDAQPAAQLRNGIAWFDVKARSIQDADWRRVSAESPSTIALFLSWAPRGSSAGVDALDAFDGDVVVVVGDRGRWTGCERFHAKLAQSWTEVLRRDILRWPRMEDDLRVFVRK